MGLLVEGKWQDQWYETKNGEFKRENSQLHNTIEPAKNKNAKFPAESGRYHLYVSLACPWAHRAIIFRALKNLEEHISLSIVSPDMLENGWEFPKNSHAKDLPDAKYLYQIYTTNDPKYTGRVTVPVLWDKKTNKIVNNESSEIIRILNTAFNDITNNHDDYYPKALQKNINKINDFVYENINNGVYRCGFATTQQAYNEGYKSLFTALDKIESILATKRYLAGDNITEADWRLFTTLIRFDEVYFGHFKCNKKSIEDYPNIAEYRRELYQWPKVANTVNFEHIKRHYYFSHTMINPTQIVPLGPEIDYARRHKRT